MSKPIIAVSVCTLVALLATTVWVPVARWERERLGGNLPEKLQKQALEEARARGDSDTAAFIRGEWVQRKLGWPPRYAVVWGRGERVEGGWGTQHLAEDRIRWRWLIVQQSLLLLMGGGLLAALIRRARRDRAAAR